MPLFRSAGYVSLIDTVIYRTTHEHGTLQVPALVWEDGGSQYCGVIESRGLTRFLFRFFEAERVAALTMLVSRYKIEVKEEPEFAGETFEERYARMTAFHENLTTT